MSAATADGGGAQILDRTAAEAVAAWLRVLGDATRLQLLELLARSDDPMTVRELTEAIGLAQSTVSFHLARLADAQLVLVERTGRTNPYRLNPDARLTGRPG